MTAQVEKTKEEFTQQQQKIMDNASKQLNEIIQKQFPTHQVTLAQENGKMFLYVKTTDGQPMNEKFGAELKKAVLQLKGPEFVAAGMALQKDGCDAKEFERVSKSETSQQALRNLLNKSNIGITKETSEEKGEGEGKGAKAYAFTNEQLRNEEKLIKSKEFEKGYIKKAAEKEVQKELKETSGITTDVKDEGVLIRMGLMDVPSKKYDPKQTKAYLEMYFTDSELKEFAVIIYSRNMIGTQKFYEELADGKIKGMKPEDFGVKRKDDGTITITYKYKGKDKTQELVGKNGINIQGHADFCHLNQNNDKTNPKGIKAREKMHEYRVAEITKDEIGKNAWNDLSKRVKEACSGCSMIGVADGLIRKEKDIYSDLAAKKVQKLKEAEGLA